VTAAGTTLPHTFVSAAALPDIARNRRLKTTLRNGSQIMLGWAIVFFIVAIIAMIFGFTGIAGAAAWIAQVLFFLFLVFFVISLVMYLVRGRSPRPPA
jgi:uncharacterized membrane protein YtjA (UPF0391 family)